MTHYLRGSCALLAVASCLWTAAPLHGASTTQPVPVTPAPEPLPAGLQKTIDYEIPQGTTLGAVIDDLRKITGANIVVNWDLLQTVGISPDTEVRLPKVTAVPVIRVLDLLLQQVSATTAGLAHLTWTNKDGVITITTKDQLSESLDLRIYDVSELANLLATLEPASGKPSTPAQQVARLEGAIIETVEPRSWRDPKIGTGIRALGGQLVITQTVLVHDKIDRLLQQLYEAALKANPLE